MSGVGIILGTRKITVILAGETREGCMAMGGGGHSVSSAVDPGCGQTL
jgi:hypothetical protein